MIARAACLVWLLLLALAACGTIRPVSSPNMTAVPGEPGTAADIATGGRANDFGLGAGRVR